jgi:hypothetical protein
LIAGDAFVTTKQESLFAALLKPQAVHGPPAYFTTDWDEAEASVRRLEQLRPEVAATGHGLPMYGEAMRRQLDSLASHITDLAVPSDGRYVHRPALADERGVFYVPSPVFPPSAVLLALAAGATIGALTARMRR